MAEMKSIILARDADVKLIIGRESDPSNLTQAAVCSKSLAKASPVFTALLLGGNFQESRGNQANAEEWVVELPADKVSPMLILLKAVHWQSPGPGCFELNALYDLIVLADKYDMFPVVKSRARTWWESIHHKSPRLWSITKALKALFLAWYFGDEKAVQLAVGALASSCPVNGRGELFDDLGSPLRSLGIPVPEGLLGMFSQRE